jgi:hypothetical protein
VFWWDIRHLVDPIEKLVLANSKVPNRRPLGAVRQITPFVLNAQVLHLLISTTVHRLHCSSECHCCSAVRLITKLGIAHVLTACDALQASIEYSVGAGPTKFAVGCEEGMIYSCNRRCAAAVPRSHLSLDTPD